jgi:hypothetical protein
MPRDDCFSTAMGFGMDTRYRQNNTQLIKVERAISYDDKDLENVTDEVTDHAFTATTDNQ